MPASSSAVSKREGSAILEAIMQSALVVQGREAACVAAGMAWKVARSTGKAAWIAGTTFLVLAVPLIFATDHEQQLNEFETQQQALLGPSPSPAA